MKTPHQRYKASGKKAVGDAYAAWLAAMIDGSAAEAKRAKAQYLSAVAKAEEQSWKQ